MIEHAHAMIPKEAPAITVLVEMDIAPPANRTSGEETVKTVAVVLMETAMQACGTKQTVKLTTIRNFRKWRL